MKKLKNFNRIQMNVGKSRLLSSLRVGNTLYVLISAKDSDLGGKLPFNSHIMVSESYQDALITLNESKKMLNRFDTIIFYSNETLEGNLEYVENISEIVDLGKCIFLFGLKEGE